MKSINELNVDIEYFTRICFEKYGDDLVSIVLFGSRSRGYATQRSDIDFIIVLNKKVDEEILRKLRLDYILKFGKNIDTICLTKKDALDNFNRISPLFATLVLGIKILYDKNAFFEREFNKFINIIKCTEIKYYEGDKLWELHKICTGILQ